jgi:uncharacterized membrane protein
VRGPATGIQIKSTGRYILLGLITAAPLGITWLILDFLFSQLSSIGRPWVLGLARAVSPEHPDVAAWLQNETFLSILAAVAVLAFLLGLGWMASRVIGQRLIDLFERLLGMIPFVDTIYRATKKLLTVAANSPEGGRLVVLIDFPSPEMKAVGLVMRVLKDTDTGEELAVVYVPTSPNPTSGFAEIVPIRHVTFTDWTFDQAMSFIVTGGSNAPATISYSGKRGAAAGPHDAIACPSHELTSKNGAAAVWRL